jgi:hypothetical protein
MNPSEGSNHDHHRQSECCRPDHRLRRSRRLGGLLGEGPRPPGQPGRGRRGHGGRRRRPRQRPPDDSPQSPEPKAAKNSVHLVLITDHYDEEIERLTGLGARPLNEIKLPAVHTGGMTFSVSQTTFADPEGNEFDLVIWQQQPE